MPRASLIVGGLYVDYILVMMAYQRNCTQQMDMNPQLSLTPVAWYVLVNVIAALAIAADKAAARAGAHRVSEKMLFAMAVAGGWPASAVMQQLVRHKTRKVRFQVIFWACAAAHCLLATAMYQWIKHYF